MPYSFSRMAGRPPWRAARSNRTFGSVSVIAGQPAGRCPAGGRVPPVAPPTARAPSFALAQVRVDDGAVGAHLVGRPLGDLLAVIQHHHAARDVHDDPHVVLDQDDRRPPLVGDVEDEAWWCWITARRSPRGRPTR